uniref:Uncharacterized protein n=2 Tax=Anguilla anguilla TaxID=7936 RepID=A0A0E9SYE8_ANGAN
MFIIIINLRRSFNPVRLKQSSAMLTFTCQDCWHECANAFNIKVKFKLVFCFVSTLKGRKLSSCQQVKTGNKLHSDHPKIMFFYLPCIKCFSDIQ